MHILFGGTKLLQATGDKGARLKTPDGGCLAMVLRTGFGTAQGEPHGGGSARRRVHVHASRRRGGRVAVGPAGSSHSSLRRPCLQASSCAPSSRARRFPLRT